LADYLCIAEMKRMGCLASGSSSTDNIEGKDMQRTQYGSR
jgi:hypothetical protein